MQGEEVESVATVEPSDAEESQELKSDNPTTLTEASPREIVIINGDVDGIEQLLDDLASSDRDYEVFVLDSQRDGIEQISEILDGRRDIDSVHIVSHGDGGQVRLGATSLTESTLDGYAGQIATWSGSLSLDADILFYGCDLAATQSGEDLVESLSALTGADVAASVDQTGHADLGGDWAFEFGIGTLETEVAFSGQLQAGWMQTLAVSAESLFLHTDGSTGSEDSTIEATETPPVGTLSEFDGNGGLGKKLSKDNGGLSQSDGSKFQLWYGSPAGYPSGYIVEGNVSFDINARSMAVGDDGYIEAFLTVTDASGNIVRDITPSGGPHAVAVTSTSFASYNIDFGSVNDVFVASDERLAVKIVNRMPSADADIEIAYGVTDLPATTLDFTARDPLIVTSTADTLTPGTLRWAINTANADSGMDRILFDIAGGGPHSIDVGSAYNTISGAVVIDGTSDPDGIVINGGGTIAGTSGLVLNASASGSTIRGLIINGFDDAGILLNDSDNNTIEGNYLGTDATGFAAGGMNNGIRLDNSDNNVIGGNTTAARNLISGNDISGVVIENGSTGNVVAGNYIGTTADGNSALGNFNGVYINQASNNTIGGNSSTVRNVISGNNDEGVEIAGNTASGNKVQGNYIGTTADGLVALGNQGEGVAIEDAPNNTIGGDISAEYNVIADSQGNGGNNVGAGVLIYGNDASGNLIQGNYIGTDVTETLDFGNAADGVLITNQGDGSGNIGGAHDNLVGGTSGSFANVIANNLESGISVAAGADNALLRNVIYSNASLGIDLLADDLVEANSPGDADNYPVLATAVANSVGGAVVVTGTLDSTPGVDFRLEFYRTSGPGNGQGDEFVDSLTVTGAAGPVAFSTVWMSGSFSNGDYITATATEIIGGVEKSTSEYATNLEIEFQPAVSNLGGTRMFVEDGGAIQIDTNVAVTDLDATNFNGGTLTVDIDNANGTIADRLSIGDQGSGAGNIHLVGNDIHYNASATAFASFSGGIGDSDPLLITFNNTLATETAVERLIENVRFDNVSDTPSTADRNVQVILTDSDGHASTGSVTVEVQKSNDAPTGDVTIGGTPTEGQTLTASNTLADVDGMTGATVTYQWKRNGADISGATASTYVLAGLDVGTTISVVGNYVDDEGFANSQASGGVGPIVHLNDAPLLNNLATMTLPPIDWSQIDSDGNTVTALLASVGDPITDVNAGASEGIAVVGVDNTNGVWQYSTDFTTTRSWTAFAADIADGKAVLLAADDPDTRIRFVPSGVYAGTATMLFRAWDQTSGTPGQVDVNIAATGTSTAFSDDVAVGQISVQNPTYLDQFNSVSFSGDDGTRSWSNDWQEINEASGPGAGDILIQDGAGDAELDLRIKNNRGVWREADLSVAGTATLTFDYIRGGLEVSDSVVVYAQIGGTGATAVTGAPGTWDEVGRIDGPGADANFVGGTVDLSAHMAVDTRIMFVAEGLTQGNDVVFLDNIQIEYTVSNSVPVANDDGYSVGENGTLAVIANGVLNNDNDADLDILSVSLVAGPSDAAAFNLNVDGSFSYTPNGGFTGTDSFTYRANDGITDSSTATVTITVNATGELWFTTKGDGDATGTTWFGTELVRFGEGADTFDIDGGSTTGTFSKLPGFVAPADIRAFHYVETNLRIGDTGTHFDLNSGDLLMTLDQGGGTVALNFGLPTQFDAGRGDVVVFRVDVAGDYSAGEWFMLFEDGVHDASTTYNIRALSLVETDTMVGDVTLTAGTFLVAHSNSSVHHNIYTFTATGTGIGGATVTSDRADLLLGVPLGLDPEPTHPFSVQGLHLLQQDTRFGATTLTAGQLLVQVNGDDTYAGQTVQPFDIAALTVTQTEQGGVPGTAASAMLFFDGSDIELTVPTDETLNGFAIISSSFTLTNTAPVADAGGPYVINEGDSLILNGSGSSDTELDTITYTWDIDGDGQYDDAVGETPTVSWADLGTMSLPIQDDGSFTISMRADDGRGGVTTDSVSLTVNNVAPTVTATGSATVIVGQLYTLNLAAVDPGDDTVANWTVNWGDGTIDTIAGNPSTATHTYTQSGFTRSITVAATDEDGTTTSSDLIVGNYESGSDSIRRYDGSTGAFESSFETSGGEVSGPYSTTVGPDGNFYVAGYYSDNVVRYDASGNYLGEFIASGFGGLDNPTEIAFGPDGKLYVANYWGANILQFDATGNSPSVFSSGGGMNGPTGLVWGPDGDLYVSNWTNGRIYKVDGSVGGSPSLLISSGLSRPEQMTFDAAGNLYIADGNNDAVKKWDGSNLTTYLSHPSLDRPTGLTFGPDGWLYVSSYDDDRVIRFDGSTTETFVSVGSGGLNDPEFLLFTPAHQVTVVNSSPVISSDGGGATAAIHVEEGNTSVTMVTATDSEAPPQILTYSITGGLDSSSFSIDASTGALTFDSAPNFDTATDSNGDNVYEVEVTVSDGFSGTDVQDISVTVTDRNQAPTITAGVLPSIMEDNSNPIGATVSSLFGGSFVDTDGGSSLSGIVVVGNTTNPLTEGSWQYSSDGGANWFHIGTVNDSGNGLTIASASSVRFLAVANYNGTPTALQVRGLDDSFGGSFSTTAGVQARQTTDTSSPNGSSAFSDPAVTLGTSVTANNDAPMISNVGDVAVNDNATVMPFGSVTIDDVEGNNVTTTVTLSGGDANGQFTPASLLASGFTKTGAGQYTLSSTTTAATTTAIRQLVFDPTENQIAADLAVVTSFTISVDDGIGTSDDNSTDVTATSINDAPTLGPGSLAATLQDDLDPPGATVSSLFGGSFSDVDTGSMLSGIIVVDNSANSVTEGTWQYSSNGGTNWFDIGIVNDSGNGLAIAAASLVRFVPVIGFTASPTSLSLRGLDDCFLGSFSTTSGVEVRNTVDTSVPTPVSPFSNPVTTLGTMVISNASATIAGATVGQAVNDNATRLPFAGITISDLENDNVTVVVTVSGGDANGQFAATSLVASGFTKTGIGEYSLASTTPAAAQSAIRLLVFEPTENQVAVGSTILTTLTINANDGNTSSSNSATSVVATSINSAPFIGGGTLPAVAEDSVNPVGATVASLVGATFADVDAGANFLGVVVVGNSASAVSQGVWQYSSDGGANWAIISSVNDSGNGLAVSAASLLRFVPIGDFVGTPDGLIIRGLDETYAGAFSDTSGAETRQTVDTTSPMTTSPFSAATATVGTSVTANNDVPTIVNRTIAMTAGTTLNAGSSLFQAASGDVDGDALTALLFATTAHGTFTLNADGSFTYTPIAGFTGIDSFQWQAFDGTTPSIIATVTIEVKPSLAPITPIDPTPVPTPAPTPVPDPQPPNSEPDPSPDPSPDPDGDAGPATPPANGSPGANGGGAPASPETPIDVLPSNPTESTGDVFSTFGIAKPTDTMSEDATDGETTRRSRVGSLVSGSLTETLSRVDLALISQTGVMWDELDLLRDSVDSHVQGDIIMVGAVGAAASSFTVGYVAWALRSGFLLSGLLAHMPAWQAIDPLTIMQGLGGARKTETLEEMIERRKREVNIRA